jgi:restriction system protein
LPPQVARFNRRPETCNRKGEARRTPTRGGLSEPTEVMWGDRELAGTRSVCRFHGVDMVTDIVVVVAALVLLYALITAPKTASLARSAIIARRERGFLSAARRLRFLDYRNVILADERGTTEIDVIVVGNVGIFVVEMKEYNAWIFGNEDDEYWTASYPDQSTYQFQNPLRQNFRHIKALQSRLGLGAEFFTSIVSFTGNCEFKTPMPPNVVFGDYRALIDAADGIVLTDSEVARLSEILEALEGASTKDALDAHVSDLKARYSSTTVCPRCGGKLVQRRARNAAPGDPGFLGCQAYPRCRYIGQLDTSG